MYWSRIFMLMNLRVLWRSCNIMFINKIIASRRYNVLIVFLLVCDLLWALDPCFKPAVCGTWKHFLLELAIITVNVYHKTRGTLPCCCFVVLIHLNNNKLLTRVSCLGECDLYSYVQLARWKEFDSLLTDVIVGIERFWIADTSTSWRRNFVINLGLHGKLITAIFWKGQDCFTSRLFRSM